MGRSAATWSRKDSLVVLASYMERPMRLMIPPAQERERIANLLRHDVREVTARLWSFAALDPENSSSGAEVGKRELELWEQYEDDRLQLMLAADVIIEESRKLPHYLSD